MGLGLRITAPRETTEETNKETTEETTEESTQETTEETPVAPAALRTAARLRRNRGPEVPLSASP